MQYSKEASAVLESEWQRLAAAGLQQIWGLIHLCLLHSGFLLSATQRPSPESPVSVHEFTLVACLEYILKD